VRDTAVRRGRLAEDLAAAFLSLLGYRVLERNFRYSRLEIDLIARRENVLAVVEVKMRRRPGLGGAPGAVTPAKRRDLETAAVGYLSVRRPQGVRVRFDVVTVEWPPSSPGTMVVRHLPGAFPASGRYRA
jgi:putative endonuclease